MDLLKRVWLTVLAGVLCACERDPEGINLIGAGSTAVFAVIEAGSQDLYVIVSSTERGTIPIVTVELSRGQEVFLLEQGAGRCSSFLAEGNCYGATVGNEIAPGDVWQLQVGLPDGAFISGTKRVPDPPLFELRTDATRFSLGCKNELCTPEPFNVPSVSIPFEVSSAVPSGLLELSIQPVRAFRGDLEVANAVCTIDHIRYAFETPTTVQSEFVLRGARCHQDTTPVAWDSVHARVKAVAYDSTYARYTALTIEGDALQPGSLRFGLDNGLGLFAGAGSTTRSITLTR
jgi:hypothetical protein